MHSPPKRTAKDLLLHMADEANTITEIEVCTSRARENPEVYHLLATLENRPFHGLALDPLLLLAEWCAGHGCQAMISSSPSISLPISSGDTVSINSPIRSTERIRT